MILNVLSCVSNREVKMTLKQGDLIPEINFCFRVGDSRPDSGTCPTGGKFVEKTKDIGPKGDDQFNATPVDDLSLLLSSIDLS